MQYLMEHGIVVSYGEGPHTDVAIFRPDTESHLALDLKGYGINTNGVEPFKVTYEFKEITEIIDGLVRTTRVDPEFLVQRLDALNWAGFCYLLPYFPAPIIIFISKDHYIDLNEWTEISTQKAIELINCHTIPKEKENAA